MLVFIIGLIVGFNLGFLVMVLISAGKDDR